MLAIGQGHWFSQHLPSDLQQAEAQSSAFGTGMAGASGAMISPPVRQMSRASFTVTT